MRSLRHSIGIPTVALLVGMVGTSITAQPLGDFSLSTDICEERGQAALDVGQRLVAAAWFSKAFDAAPNDSASRRVNRLRVESLLQRGPRRVLLLTQGTRFHDDRGGVSYVSIYTDDGQVLFLDPKEPDRRYQHRGTDVRLLPNGRVICVSEGRQLQTTRLTETDPAKKSRAVQLPEDYRLEISTDGRCCVIASEARGEIFEVDVETGEPKGPPFADDYLDNAVLSPTGTKLAYHTPLGTCIRTRKAGRWEFTNLLKAPLKHRSAHWFDKSGRYLIAWTPSNFEVWRVDGDAPIYASFHQTENVLWHPENAEFFAVKHDIEGEDKILVFSAPEFNPTTLISLKSSILCAAYSGDGSHIAVATNDNEVSVYRGSTLVAGPLPHVFRNGYGRDESISDIAFDPSGRFLLVTGLHATSVWEWNATGSNRLLTAPPDNVSPDGKVLVSVPQHDVDRQAYFGIQASLLSVPGHSEDDPTFIVDRATNRDLGESQAPLLFEKDYRRALGDDAKPVGSELEPHAYIFTNNKSEVLSCFGNMCGLVGYYGGIVLQDAPDSKNGIVFGAKKRSFYDAALSPCGRYVFGVSEHGLYRWKRNTTGVSDEAQVLGGGSGGWSRINFSPDGRLVSGAGGVWIVQTGEELFERRSISTAGNTAVTAFSPDGTRLCSVVSIAGAESRGTLRIWAVPQGHQVGQTVQIPAGRPLRLLYSADGTLLFIAFHDESGMIVDARSGRTVFERQPTGMRPLVELSNDKLEGIRFPHYDKSVKALATFGRSSRKSTSDFGQSARYSAGYEISDNGDLLIVGFDEPKGDHVLFKAEISRDPEDHLAFLDAYYSGENNVGTEGRAWQYFSQRKPDSADAYLRRAGVWLNKGEYERAVSDCNAALKLDSAAEEALSLRGHANRNLGRYDSAIADFNARLKTKPEDAEALAGRGRAWFAKGDFEKALTDLGEAIRFDESVPSPYYADRAAIRRVQGNYSQALEDFESAIGDNRFDKPNIRLQLSDFHRSLRNFDQAIEGFQDVVAGEHPDTDLRSYSAILNVVAARESGDRIAIKRSLAALESMQLSGWPEPIFRFFRGECDEAQLLSLADDRNKKTEAHCYLGLDHMIRGKAVEAKRHFEWVRDHGNCDLIEYCIALDGLRILSRSNHRSEPDRPSLAQPSPSTTSPPDKR